MSANEALRIITNEYLRMLDNNLIFTRQFHALMRKFDEGTLVNSSGDPVTDRKDAAAIAFSEAQRAKK